MYVELVGYAHMAATHDVTLPAPTAGEAFAAAATWASGAVVPGLLLLWVAARGAAHPLRPAAAGCGAAALWAVLGQVPTAEPILPWLGPVRPYDWLADTAQVGLTHPGRYVPVLVVLASLLTAWGARGLPTHDVRDVRRTDRTREGLVALLTLAGLAVLCTGLATGAAVAATGWPGATWWELARAPEIAGQAAHALALVVVAVLASGRPWAIAPLVLAWLCTAAPWATTWFDGGGDVLLLPPALTAAATLLAWLWRPCAIAFRTSVRPPSSRRPVGASGPAAPQSPKGPTLTTDRG